MVRKRLNKRGVSPLVATLLLVVFALIVGTVTMTLGQGYVSEGGEEEHHTEDVTILAGAINTPLKELMIEHLQGEISEAEFRSKI